MDRLSKKQTRILLGVVAAVLLAIMIAIVIDGFANEWVNGVMLVYTFALTVATVGMWYLMSVQTTLIQQANSLSEMSLNLSREVFQHSQRVHDEVSLKSDGRIDPIQVDLRRHSDIEITMLNSGSNSLKITGKYAKINASMFPLQFEESKLLNINTVIICNDEEGVVFLGLINHSMIESYIHVYVTYETNNRSYLLRCIIHYESHWEKPLRIIPTSISHEQLFA